MSAARLLIVILSYPPALTTFVAAAMIWPRDNAPHWAREGCDGSASADAACEDRFCAPTSDNLAHLAYTYARCATMMGVQSLAPS